MEILQLSQAEVTALTVDIPFFTGFSDEDIGAIVRYGDRILQYDTNEVILVEEGPGDAFYVLLEGEVSVQKGKRERIPIAKLRQGSLFGEMALFNHQPRSSTVTASRESIVMKIDNALLEALDRTIYDKIMREIIAVLATRLDKMNNLLLSMVRITRSHDDVKKQVERYTHPHE